MCARHLMRNQGFAEAQLDGLNLRIVTVPQAPFVYYDASKTGNDAYTGYYIDFWNLLALRLSQNFTWAFYNSPDGKFGGLSPDGNWTGMIKEILDGNADLAVADFTITSARYANSNHYRGALTPSGPRSLRGPWPSRTSVWR